MISGKIRNTTREHFLPKVVDGILGDSPLVKNVLTRTERWTGEKMKKAVKVAKATNGTTFNLSSIQNLNTAPQDTRTRLEFEPKGYIQPVTVPLGQVAVNAGSTTEDKFLNLAEIEMESAAQDMADAISQMFYGLGLGDAFQGLEKIVDDGTNSVAYGGESRTAHPEAFSSTVIPTGGPLTLSAMRTAHSGAKRGNIRPSAIYTTEEIFGFYESLLQPQERIQKSGTVKQRLVGGTGYADLFYIDMPIFTDENCPDGIMYMIREKDLTFYAVTDVPDTEPISVAARQVDESVYEGAPGLGFRATDWRMFESQTGYGLNIMLMGELISWAPRSHAKLTGITTV